LYPVDSSYPFVRLDTIRVERQDPPRPLELSIFGPRRGCSSATVLLLPGKDAGIGEYEEVIRGMVKRGIVVIGLECNDNEGDDTAFGKVAKRASDDAAVQRIVQRLLDVKIMVSNIGLIDSAIQKAVPGLQIDRGRFGVFGHSIGALQALVLGGLLPGRFTRPIRKDVEQLQSDLALKAVFFMEGASKTFGNILPKLFLRFNLPILVAVGTHDNDGNARADDLLSSMSYPFSFPVGDSQLRRFLVTYSHRSHWLGGDATAYGYDIATLDSVGLLAAAFFDAELNGFVVQREALRQLADEPPEALKSQIKVEMN